MTKKIIHDIIDYVEYLKTLSLRVSYCDPKSNFAELYRGLIPYNAHLCEFCAYVKSSKTARETCVAKQKKVLKAAENGAFYGACYAGAEEFVFPVSDGEKTIAFISVSGYRSKENEAVALEKLAKLCKTHQLSEREAKEKYASLSEDKPTMTALTTLLSPLCHMFALLYLTREEEAPQNTAYRKILRYLNEHYTEKINLADVAASCHYSPSYVRHVFRRGADETLTAYVTSLRIAHAKKLLKNTDLSVSEIATTVGYEEPNYFTNVFGKTVGVSPKEYRNKKRS